MDNYVVRLKLYLGVSIRFNCKGTDNFTTINGMSSDVPVEVTIEEIGSSYFATCYIPNGISMHVWCDDYFIEYGGAEEC